jgi:hypothetical protein
MHKHLQKYTHTYIYIYIYILFIYLSVGILLAELYVTHLEHRKIEVSDTKTPSNTQMTHVIIRNHHNFLY